MVSGLTHANMVSKIACVYYVYVGIHILRSGEAGLWCLYTTSSYKEAVLKAVNLGGDTDTIGAITGSLAGLYYGYEEIPKEWVKELKNKKLIDSICDRFYEQYK